MEPAKHNYLDAVGLHRLKMQGLTSQHPHHLVRQEPDTSAEPQMQALWGEQAAFLAGGSATLGVLASGLNRPV